MIESLQKEIHRPEITPSSSLQTGAQNIPSTTPKVQETEPQKEPKESDDPSLKLFIALRAKIQDRNFELGSCFEKSITFLSYDEGVLRWESCASEECKKVLTHGYSVIKQLVREVFGFETKIKHELCTKAPEEPTQEEEQPEPSSMIEESELGGSASCVANCPSSDSVREIDGAKILEEPMIQRATELFEATKITVQSKI